MENFNSILNKVLQIAQGEALKRGNPTLTVFHLLWGLVSAKETFFSKAFKDDKNTIKEGIDKLSISNGVKSELKGDHELHSWFITVSGDAAQEGVEVQEKHLLRYLSKYAPFLNLTKLQDNQHLQEETEEPLDFLTNLNELAKENKLDPVIGRENEIRAVMEILARRGKNNPVLVGSAGVGKTAIVEGLALKIIKEEVVDFLKDKEIYSLDMGCLMAGTKFQGEFEERLKKLIKFLKSKNGNAILFIDEIHQLVGAGKTQGAMDAANLLKPSLARGEFLVIGATTQEEYQKYILNDSALDRRFRNVTINEPSKEDTIKILMGLKEKFEIHHGIKITDSTIYSSVLLADQYITNKNFPDKSIDLIDEASASLKLSTESIPEDLVKLKHELRNKKIQEQLESNNENIKNEIVKLEELIKKETQEWENKILSLKELSTVQNKIDSLNIALEKAQRDGNFEEASKLKYALLPDAHKELEVLKLSRSGNLEKEDIAKVISRYTGIPLEKVLKTEQENILKLESFLNKNVFGQEEVLNEISETLMTSYAGIKDQTKPLASFLLKGPSGVGKTETAKALAKYLFNDEKNMVRFDMSEFSEKHSVAKLVGSPAGYVGYEEGGILTEAIRKKPYTVILFDEIEKAHPDFSDILLQLMDDGRLTDNKGRTANFNNTIVILTTNSQNIEMDFKPEVIGRLDSILEYEPLKDNVLNNLIEKQLSLLNNNLKDKGISIILNQNLIDELKARGYSEHYGARPLANLFNKIVMRPLSKMILEGRINKGNYCLGLEGNIKEI